MPLTLNQIPGFADLPDASLVHDTPALAIYIDRINANAAFGMTRMEAFRGVYKHGDTIPLPVSPIDGYNYSHDELIYCWGVQSSLNPATGWISGPITLWYCNWFVQQWSTVGGADNTDAGKVSCIEWYGTGQINDYQQSNDGTLLVVTIGQRQLRTIFMAAEATTFTDLPNSDFATDKALTESLLQTLNDDAKFSVVGTECIYLGEYVDGDTISLGLLVSPVDGHAYAYSDCKFTHSWRWTTSESDFIAPSRSIGLLHNFDADVDSSGNVSINVLYKVGGSPPARAANFGRIAVFAFCARSLSLAETGDEFAEINQDLFMPGSTLRASTLSQLNKNIREAACSPEFFGPTNYSDGDTIGLPTSPIDGYTYVRAELAYVAEWSKTHNKSTGQYYRQPAFRFAISALGAVSITVWRFLPGGPYVTEPAGDSDDEIKVLVIGLRARELPELTGQVVAHELAGTLVDDPYVISFFGGDAIIPTASQVLLAITIAGSNIIGGGRLPQFLVGSSGGCLTAPTASWAMTITQNGITVGTMNIAAGATRATFSFSLTAEVLPGDLFKFLAPGTPDTTIAGIYCTLSGVRYAASEGGDFS